MKLNNVLKLLSIIGVLLTVTSGCTTVYTEYKTQINAYDTSKFPTIINDMTAEEVHTSLGVPVFHAQLQGGKRIERYYSEHMKYTHESGGAVLSYMTYRDTQILDVWYKNGKVENVSYISSEREYVRNPEASFRDFYEWGVRSAYLNYYPIIGTAYDFDQATKLTIGQKTSHLLWNLGVPNRVLSSKFGDKFIYEYGDFRLDEKTNESANYMYSKSVITIKNGIITDVSNFNTDIDLVEAIRKNDDDFLTLFTNLFRWHAVGTDSFEKCTETDQCELDDYFDIISNTWEPYPELVKLSYYVIDLDLGSVRKDRIDFFNQIVTYSNSDTRDPEIELYYVLKSTLPSSLIAGKDSFSTIFYADRYKKIETQLKTNEGDLARTWLNIAQPTKFYFNKEGLLDSKLIFSLSSPMSPWYTFGPPHKAMDKDVEKCSSFSSNCTKKLKDIYSSSLTFPQL